MSKKTVNLNLSQLPNDYIRLINTFFGFSESEISILSELIRQNSEEITTTSRKNTVQNLGLTGEKLLNNHIKRIKEKGGIYKDGKSLHFRSILINNSNSITFSW
jgi:hypothetical protein